ncbi:MAG TPA: M20/M25/M40 family metallo-hydrolase [Herpetosiphonaceae bacterium]
MTDWFEQVRDLSIRLVRWPSVTDTPGETDFGRRLYDLLAALPYFQAHPDHLLLLPTSHDLRERFNVLAFVGGASPRTVALAGHYDVVSVANYGPLADAAFDPEALLPRLIEALEAGERSEADELALRDLRGGDYLPGRGMLDMKSGIAAGLAVLMRWAELPAPPGGLLLLATPDEEVASHGMRSAAAQLAELAAADRWGLELAAAINLDASDDRGDGSEGRAVFMGTVGKFLPCVYLVGRDTHAGSPFDGIGANLLAAEVTRRIDCNVDLIDVADGVAAPPPVSLKQIDLKRHYDVTTPGAAWCYFNVLTHGRQAGEVLGQIIGQVRDGLADAIDYACEQSRRFELLTGRANGVSPWPALVLSYEELCRRVDERSGLRSSADWRRLLDALAGDQELDAPEVSRRIVEALWAASGLAGPAAVVAFGSLHYPASLVGERTPGQARLRAIVAAQAAAVGAELGMPVSVRPFFPGISDMSFLGGAVSPGDEAILAANTPAWGSRIRVDYGVARALDLPTINIGPWGRDYHQRTERVNMPYSFGVVPELIWRIAGELCAG